MVLHHILINLNLSANSTAELVPAASTPTEQFCVSILQSQVEH